MAGLSCTIPYNLIVVDRIGVRSRESGAVNLKINIKKSKKEKI